MMKEENILRDLGQKFFLSGIVDKSDFLIYHLTWRK